MAKIKITPLREEFERQISDNFSLIESLVEIKKTHKKLKIKPTLSQDNIYLVAELSFLKIFVAWEQFLENSFINYMLGGETNRGRRAKRYIFPKDSKHALSIVCEGRPFANWATPSEVIRKAELFFARGKPFKDSLWPIQGTINDMQTIRNYLAHMSIESREKFKELVRSELTYFPYKNTPGKFLLTKNPSARPQIIFLRYYTDILKNTAKKIIP